MESLHERMKKYIHPFSVIRVRYDFLEKQYFYELYQSFLKSNFQEVIYLSPTVFSCTLKEEKLVDILLTLESQINTSNIQVGSVPFWEIPNWFINCQNLNRMNYFKYLAEKTGIILPKNTREWEETLKKETSLEEDLQFRPFAEGLLFINKVSHIANFKEVVI